MSLAYSLCEENISSIGTYKDDYFNKIIDLSEYRDCREFVSFVNNKKLFSFGLILLEFRLIKPEEFDIFYSTNQELINKVKEYPNKDLKRRYLRIDSDEIEILNFAKDRCQQIKNNEYCNIIDIIKDSNSNNNKSNEDFDTIPVSDLISLMLGGVYEFYADQNADFLIPIVKKIIKKSNLIAKRYSLFQTETNNMDFDELNKRTNIQYKRALDVLSE